MGQDMFKSRRRDPADPIRAQAKKRFPGLKDSVKSRRGRICAIILLFALVLCLAAGAFFALRPSPVDSGETELVITSFFAGMDNEGDAVLLQSAGYNLLMDTGNTTTGEVVEKLRERGISQLDLYLSHWHDDHYGQITAILDDPFFTVGRIYLPDPKPFERLYDPGRYSKASWWNDFQRTWAGYQHTMDVINKKQIEVKYLSQGSVFKVGTAKAKVIYRNTDPTLDNRSDKSRTYINNTSLVTMVTTKSGIRYLTCGDIEAETEEEMLRMHVGIRCEIFKMSHHGGSTSNTEKFIEKAAPAYAFYNFREKKFNRKPNFIKDAVSRMTRISTVFSGATNGDLTFTVRGGVVSVQARKRTKEETVYYRRKGSSETEACKLVYNLDAPKYLDACALPRGAMFVSGGEDLKVRVKTVK